MSRVEPVGYQTIYIRRMWTCQIESESSLPRATDKAEEGSKNGLRRASNLTKFPWGACPRKTPYLLRAYACSHVLTYILSWTCVSTFFERFEAKCFERCSVILSQKPKKFDLVNQFCLVRGWGAQTVTVTHGTAWNGERGHLLFLLLSREVTVLSTSALTRTCMEANPLGVLIK